MTEWAKWMSVTLPVPDPQHWGLLVDGESQLCRRTRGGIDATGPGPTFWPRTCSTK